MPASPGRRSGNHSTGFRRLNISSWVDLFDTPLPLHRVLDFVGGDPALGGIVTFFGATRGEHHAQHGDLLRLEYEAYREMAVNQMRMLAERAGREWAARRVVVLHRLGAVAVAEVSVAIAVACPHRAEAFEACRWLIDSLKQDVPIWKKDVFVNGFSRWVEPQSEPRTSVRADVRLA